MTSSISTTTASDMGDFLNIEKLNFLMLYQEIQNMKAETMNHKTEIQNLKDQNQAMQMEIQNLKIMNQQQQIDNLRFQNDILKTITTITQLAIKRKSQTTIFFKSGFNTCFFSSPFFIIKSIFFSSFSYT